MRVKFADVKYNSSPSKYLALAAPYLTADNYDDKILYLSSLCTLSEALQYQQ